MMFSFSKLRGKIREVLGSEQEFHKQMGFDSKTGSYKLNGKVEFKRSEIEKACQILGIKPIDVSEYFFIL